MVSLHDRGPAQMQDYMINWNVGPLGLVLRPDLGADMPPVVAQVLPGESVASLAGVSVGDMLVSVNGKKASKLGYEKAMKLLYKQKLPMILHFRIPQIKTQSLPQQQLMMGSGDPSMVGAPYQSSSVSSVGSSHPHHHNPHHGPAAAAAIASYQANHVSQTNYQPYAGHQQHHQQPGQYVQYNQQQQQQQQQQQGQYNQPSQQQQHRQRANDSELSTASSSSTQLNQINRAQRTLSMLSTSNETREQKLRKQFSAVWESGSLGFSFRPYAPNVNIPTVDLIAARGQGKNMDLVCVNDVLIAINGERTQLLGVERVLKMLHVMEKPVVLRFHKSSHRIENPAPPLPPSSRLRRKSTSKLPAVEEKLPERVQEEEEEEDDEEDEATANQMAGVFEEEDMMPSVRFALADTIQLRSESSTHGSQAPLPPPPPPVVAPSKPTATETHTQTRRMFVDHEDEVKEDKDSKAVAASVSMANQFAARVGSSRGTPSGVSSQRNHLQRQTSSHSATHREAPAAYAAPPPPPAAPISMPAPSSQDGGLDLATSDRDLDDDHDDDAGDVEGPPVTISVVGSQSVKRAVPCFVIPLEHAREIVAKSSGKPVEQCEFGGVQLLQIKEGTVQARLLVTFAKACLAKQMKQARGEDVGGVSSRPQKQKQQLQQPQATSRGSLSSGRHSAHSSTERRSTSDSVGQPRAPSNATTFEGNTLAPGRPKFLAYSFQQGPANASAAVGPSARNRAPYLALPPSEAGSMETHPAQFNSEFGDSSDAASPVNSPTAFSHEDGNAVIHEEGEEREQHEERTNEPSVVLRDARSSSETHLSSLLSQPKFSDTSSRSSAGGLTLSQLRVSGNIPSHELDEVMASKFKDLGEMKEVEQKHEISSHVTEMIALDTLLELRVSEQVSKQQSPRADGAAAAAMDGVEEEDKQATKDAVATDGTEPHAEPDLAMSSSVEGDDEDTRASFLKQSDHKVDVAPKTQQAVAPPLPPTPAAATVGVTAHPDHPIVQSLCAQSRDLEFVLVGRSVNMILLKKKVVEEIQDILDSLEMELQFERHSHVGIGRGSIIDEPLVRCCSRCGKHGDLADLALDGDRRELYCSNCWEVFFYHENESSSSPRSSHVPPEFDTPTDFDPYEYSLHDSMVNVASDDDGFHPWRHLNMDDAASQRDSNVTVGSSITEHADEVWL